MTGMISRTGFFYIPAMLLVGIAIVFILRARPEWIGAALLPVAWPFLVSFLFELGLMMRVRQGRAQPLTMMDRFLGVFGAASIITAYLTFQS
jgi:hypothetical protein